MQITVKTLKGSRFSIRVHPTDTKIEEMQGKDNYPCGQQLLIHSGKVLKDERSLEESNVSEDGFLVVMLSKGNTSTPGATSLEKPLETATMTHPTTDTTTTTAEAPPQAPASQTPESQPETASAGASYGQAASNLVAPTNFEQMIDHLMDMGGGNWDKDEVTRALRAAYNNPERAVEYLYSGIPATAEVAVSVASLPSSQMSVQVTNSSDATLPGSASLSGLPNSAPLNMFPQGTTGMGVGAGGGSLDFLRQNQQFQALRTMVQSNPQILQPMLQELSKQNPQLLRLIQEHHAEFLQLINEPVEDVEGAEGDLLFDQQEDQEMPHSINVTPEEQSAIERLEALGFDRTRVIEAFLACDRNEELAANYLLEFVEDEE